MTKDIKLLVFDIDGTLIPWGKKVVESSAIEAIDKARKRGLKVCIATGRIRNFIQASVIENINADYYICVNGLIIYNHEFKVIDRHSMDLDDVLKLNDICQNMNLPLAYKWEEKIVVYHNFDGFTSQYLLGEDHSADIVDATCGRDYHLTHGLPLSAFICALEDMIPKLQAHFDNLVFVRPKHNAIEAYDKAFNKATAIKEVASLCNISLDEVMCFGDADNDKEMLQLAGIGIAMGNGSSAAKAVADYVTDDCANDGVKKALEYFSII